MEYIKFNKDNYNKLYSDGAGAMFPDTSLVSLYKTKIMPLVGVGKVLDFGCGLGNNAQFLRDMGNEVYGIDISQIAIEKCCAQHGFNKANFVAENIFEKNISDIFNTKFKLILAKQSLLHFTSNDQFKIVGQMKDSLEDGGIICADFPTYNHTEYKPYENLKKESGMINIPEVGSLHEEMMVNVLTSKYELKQLFKDFELLEILTEIKSYEVSKASYEVVFYLGRKNKI